MLGATVSLLRALRTQQAADRLAAGPAWDNPADLVVVDALGHGIRPDTYSHRFRSLSHTAAVPVIRLHAVRHTVATMLHGAGVAPADAARLLGHEVATHLATYVQGTDGGADRAADRFAQALAVVR